MNRIIYTTALVLLSVLSAHAESARTLIDTGNAAFDEQRYEDALSAYEEAETTLPEEPILYFNKGAVLYRQEDYEAAKEAFKEAAVKTKDLGLEARSNYNLGNCAFRQAERQRDSDLKKSIEALEESVQHYQRALELDPDYTDAARNIEVARLTMKTILDEIKKQQEQQQKMQEIKKTLQELIQEQQALRDHTEEAAQQGEDGKAIADPQGSLRDRTGALAQEMASLSPDPNTPSPLDGPRQLVEQATEKQLAAKERLDAGLAPDALEPQQNALALMQQALDAMQQQEDERQQQQQQEQRESGDQQQQSTDPTQQQQHQKGADQKEQQEEGADQQSKDDAESKVDDEGEADAEQQSATQSPSQEGEMQDQGQAVSRGERPEDVLEEEEQNRDRRMQIPAGHHSVDKDW